MFDFEISSSWFIAPAVFLVWMLLPGGVKQQISDFIAKVFFIGIDYFILSSNSPKASAASTLIEGISSEEVRRQKVAHSGTERPYDIIVIGSGPAGLAATKRCLTAGKSVLVLEHGSAAGYYNMCQGNGASLSKLALPGFSPWLSEPQYGLGGWNPMYQDAENTEVMHAFRWLKISEKKTDEVTAIKEDTKSDSKIAKPLHVAAGIKLESEGRKKPEVSPVPLYTWHSWCVGGGSMMDRGIFYFPPLSYWNIVIREMFVRSTNKSINAEQSILLAQQCFDAATHQNFAANDDEDKDPKRGRAPVSVALHRSPLSWAFIEGLRNATLPQSQAEEQEELPPEVKKFLSNTSFQGEKYLSVGFKMPTLQDGDQVAALAFPLLQRHSSASPRRVHLLDAWLGDHPKAIKENCRIVPEVVVTKICSSTPDATPTVTFQSGSGKFIDVEPKIGVILAAGLHGTPNILRKSQSGTKLNSQVPFRDAVSIPLVYQARPGMTLDKCNTVSVMETLRTIVAVRSQVPKASISMAEVCDGCVALAFANCPHVETLVSLFCVGGHDVEASVQRRMSSTGIHARLGVFREAFQFNITAFWTKRNEAEPATILGCHSEADEQEIVSALCQAIEWCRFAVQMHPVCHLTTGREAIDATLLEIVQEQLREAGELQDQDVVPIPEIVRILYGKAPAKVTKEMQRRATRLMQRTSTIVQTQRYLRAYAIAHASLAGFGCGSAHSLLETDGPPRESTSLPLRVAGMNRVVVGDVSGLPPVVCLGGGGNVATAAAMGNMAANALLSHAS